MKAVRNFSIVLVVGLEGALPDVSGPLPVGGISRLERFSVGCLGNVAVVTFHRGVGRLSWVPSLLTLLFVVRGLETAKLQPTGRPLLPGSWEERNGFLPA